MKEKRRAIWKYYRNFPMQKKLVFSFTAPIILICGIIAMIGILILSREYEKQLRYSVSQSCEQASNFIYNHIENMYYIAQLMDEDKDIDAILGKEEFGTHDTLAQSYREYYEVSNAFRDIEMAHSEYRIGVYLPDDILYSNNHYYFYAQSELMERTDYEEILETVQSGRIYVTIQQEERYSNRELIDTYIALLYSITVEREDEEVTYISRVAVPLDDIQNILSNAKTTRDTLVYLLNERGEYLTSSSEAEYESVRQSLPVSEIVSWNKQRIKGVTCYGVYEKIESYNWQLFSMIPIWDFARQTSFIGTMMLFITILLALAVFIISYFFSRFYVRRLSQLTDNMKKLEKGKLNAQIVLADRSEESGDEIDLIYANFNYMTERIKLLMKEHYKLGKSVMSAEIRALQAQINPHFLYNTLDLINWGALEHGAEDVACMARNLGMFYRLSLNHGRAAITIDEELRHVEAYVTIEKMHFPGAIELRMQVPEEILGYACLNIILQPFVENAIVHGIAEHPDIMECIITIAARKEGEDIIFSIHDNGPGIDVERIAEILDNGNTDVNHGYGVKNTNFRIKLCYGECYGVTYEDKPEEGTTAYLRIQAKRYEELEKMLR